MAGGEDREAIPTLVVIPDPLGCPIPPTSGKNFLTARYPVFQLLRYAMTMMLIGTYH